MKPTTILTNEEQMTIRTILQTRYEKNKNRHPDLKWSTILERLNRQPDKLWSLNQMELSGGEPDVVQLASSTEQLVFMDCSPETPKGRRSLCYDRAAWEARKEFKPANTALDVATEMGVTLLMEAEYRLLQQTGTYDLKTSSWVMTPPEVRSQGGALFCDRRYNCVFVYHNGAESYYAVRGFRAKLVI
jgi:hypothetical protein